MFIIIKGFKTNVIIIIISKTCYVMLIHFFLIVFIKHINLSINRDLIFKLKQLNALTFLTHIVNYNLSRIMIRNDIDLLIIFIKHARFDKMFKYETKKYYSI